MMLAALYKDSLDHGHELTVWYKPALQMTNGPLLLCPLYFLARSKQLYCFRNCAMVPYAHMVATALATLSFHAVYLYAGTDGDTFVLHTTTGIDETAEHRERFDYSGNAVAARKRVLPADIMRALANTDSRKQYTSIIVRTALPWQSTDLWVHILGAAATAPLPAHVMIVTRMPAKQTFLVTLPGVVMQAGMWATPPAGWRPMHVHPAHARFIPANVSTKTISSAGDCLFSALAHACMHCGMRGPLVSMLAKSADPAMLMRTYLAQSTTLDFLAERFCGSSMSALRTWLADGSVFDVGIVDPVADRHFIASVRGKSAGSVYAALMAYKCTNAYWGRDFDIQVFEAMTGVGVLVFASPDFFGDTVDILGRKPNKAYGRYILLYNVGNVHFEAVAVWENAGITGYAATDLPPWLAYIVNMSLCTDVSKWPSAAEEA
jgi:hypothetical protein